MILIQHYETTDIFLGAFLLSSGGDLSGINFNERHIATFMFTGEGLHQQGRDYTKGRALVNPVHLRASLNHLRDLLFDMRDRRRRNSYEKATRKGVKSAFDSSPLSKYWVHLTGLHPPMKSSPA